MPLAYMLGNLSFSEYEQATICHRGNDFLGRRRGTDGWRRGTDECRDAEGAHGGRRESRQRPYQNRASELNMATKYHRYGATRS